MMHRIAWTRRFGWLLCLVLIPAMAQARPKAKPKKPGHLIIQSMTDETLIEIDGKIVGKTPLAERISLPAGKHVLIGTKTGHTTVTIEFTVRPGSRTELMVDPIPHSGLVRFTADVEQAEVILDGEPVGKTPLILEIMMGDHEVRVEKADHLPHLASINVKAGAKLFIDAVLQPDPKVALATPPPPIINVSTIPEPGLPPPPVVEPVPAWYENLHERWWFWTATVAVLATAITVPVVLTTSGGQAGLNDHIPDISIHLP